MCEDNKWDEQKKKKCPLISSKSGKNSKKSSRTLDNIRDKFWPVSIQTKVQRVRLADRRAPGTCFHTFLVCNCLWSDLDQVYTSMYTWFSPNPSFLHILVPGT